MSVLKVSLVVIKYVIILLEATTVLVLKVIISVEMIVLAQVCNKHIHVHVCT